MGTYFIDCLVLRKRRSMQQPYFFISLGYTYTPLVKEHRNSTKKIDNDRSAYDQVDHGHM